ncbi:dTDP-glucose 4,6-dehydratase [Halobacteria archaeon HArc-gm2]|nr:dTDP-glucose 4,6-dehydratase [Halobacteria archaeon HArc-gm2]
MTWKLLVTGGAGFIGSNFVRYVLKETEHAVTTLDTLTYAGSKDNLGQALKSPRHTFVEADIRDGKRVNELVGNADVVVHFAAESHVDRSIDDATAFASTNVVGTQTLLEAAAEADIERFVHVSTDEVYGEIMDGTFSETDRLDPRNPYAATKAGSDLLARSYMTTHGLPVLITRSSNNFGPRQHPEKLIPKFITRADAGEPLPIYGDGSNVREWLYVHDNCRALYRVLTDGEPGQTYNVGSGIELSNLKVAKAVVDAVGASEDQIEFVEDRPSHDQRYALNTEKIQTLGWEPKWSFEDGLEKTIEYYLEDRRNVEQN